MTSYPEALVSDAFIIIFERKSAENTKHFSTFSLTQKNYQRPFRFIKNIASFYLLRTFRFADYTLLSMLPFHISF